jgi:hypothetical protein
MESKGTDSLSVQVKCWIWVLAWGAATVIMLLLAFPLYMIAPAIVFYFPTGLFRVFGLHLDEFGGFSLFAWLPYLALSGQTFIAWEDGVFFYIGSN